MLNFFKHLWISIKLIFIRTKVTIEEPKQSNSTVDTLTSVIQADALSKGIEKESKWFTRENHLVLEFAGEEPVVYESDMVTIRKQSQYGYIEDDATKIEEDIFADDVSLLSGPGVAQPIDLTGLETTHYLTKKQQFEERWAKIKEQTREEDGEIDGIIQE
jgi:hypothetical protein